MPDCDDLPDTLRRRPFSPTVRVKVGSGNAERTFLLPKKQVCAASKFFRNACKAEWVPDRNEAITLPQDDPKVFREFVVWVYTDYHGSHDLGDMNDTGEADLACKLWVLADKLQAPRLQNWLVDRLLDPNGIQASQPHPELVTYIYDNTSPNSTLRQWTIDRWVKSSSSTYHLPGMSWIDVQEKLATGYTVHFNTKPGTPEKLEDLRKDAYYITEEIEISPISRGGR